MWCSFTVVHGHRSLFNISCLSRVESSATLCTWYHHYFNKGVIFVNKIRPSFNIRGPLASKGAQHFRYISSRGSEFTSNYGLSCNLGMGIICCMTDHFPDTNEVWSRSTTSTCTCAKYSHLINYTMQKHCRVRTGNGGKIYI